MDTLSILTDIKKALEKIDNSLASLHEKVDQSKSNPSGLELICSKKMKMLRRVPQEHEPKKNENSFFFYKRDFKDAHKKEMIEKFKDQMNRKIIKNDNGEETEGDYILSITKDGKKYKLANFQSEKWKNVGKDVNDKYVEIATKDTERYKKEYAEWKEKYPEEYEKSMEDIARIKKNNDECRLRKKILERRNEFLKNKKEDKDIDIEVSVEKGEKKVKAKPKAKAKARAKPKAKAKTRAKPKAKPKSKSKAKAKAKPKAKGKTRGRKPKAKVVSDDELEGTPDDPEEEISEEMSDEEVSPDVDVTLDDDDPLLVTNYFKLNK
jgi:hypothetical protein